MHCRGVTARGRLAGKEHASGDRARHDVIVLAPPRPQANAAVRTARHRVRAPLAAHRLAHAPTAVSSVRWVKQGVLKPPSQSYQLGLRLTQYTALALCELSASQSRHRGKRGRLHVCTPPT